MESWKTSGWDMLSRVVEEVGEEGRGLAVYSVRDEDDDG